jgi:leucyl-tRNA synthetase
LRDWGISRQRYWGTPIPMIHCKHCGTVPVPEEDLPVVLPTDLIPDGKTNPLKKCTEFYKTTCPECGKAATRETDTMDTFVESSWYFARYCCANQHKHILDDRVKYWAPVDQYIGGVEHAVLHLLYARFFHKLLRDEGFVHGDEPFKKLLTQGMVLKDGFKMSKSKGNTVNPTALIKEYGADTLRLFILFAAPPTQSLEWSDSSVAGCHRYLKKVWQLCEEHSKMIKAINAQNDFILDQALEGLPPHLQTVRAQLHQLLDQANRDYDRLQFNTLVAACMKILNTLQSIEAADDQSNAIRYEGISILLRLLSPLTPHIAHALWKSLNFVNDVAYAPWPQASTHAMKEDTKEWVIQVNGKTRAKIILPTDIADDELKKAALENPKIASQLADCELLKLIVVPNKLLNIVAKKTVTEA